MHGIIISPMIYNVKRIYICLSDIFKLFQDFSREIQAIIRPHTNSHTILRFTTKRHIKRKNEARHKSWGGNYGPDDAITNKICHLLLEKYNQQNASTHKKALAQIRSRALPTVFCLALFIKIQPSHGLCKRTERSFIF